ncbi:MAG: helix-turn-helix domain-containing protein [Dehalococcoidia bacterium]|nr:MAG: helix-turn-helix domain-containing protein [Dehalococcoidia bacterium]
MLHRNAAALLARIGTFGPRVYNAVMYDERKRQHVADLAAAGMGARRIARDTGVARSTVQRWLGDGIEPLAPVSVGGPRRGPVYDVQRPAAPTYERDGDGVGELLAERRVALASGDRVRAALAELEVVDRLSAPLTPRPSRSTAAIIVELDAQIAKRRAAVEEQRALERARLRRAFGLEARVNGNTTQTPAAEPDPGERPPSPPAALPPMPARATVPDPDAPARVLRAVAPLIATARALADERRADAARQAAERERQVALVDVVRDELAREHAERKARLDAEWLARRESIGRADGRPADAPDNATDAARSVACPTCRGSVEVAPGATVAICGCRTLVHSPAPATPVFVPSRADVGGAGDALVGIAHFVSRVLRR